jgi:hypothetical protein
MAIDIAMLFIDRISVCIFLAVRKRMIISIITAGDDSGSTSNSFWLQNKPMLIDFIMYTFGM